MQTPTLDPTTQETPEQRAFAEIAARVTAKDVLHEQAKEARDRFNYEHPLKTLSVQARLAELQDEVERTGRELQNLLEPYARLKDLANGW